MKRVLIKGQVVWILSFVIALLVCCAEGEKREEVSEQDAFQAFLPVIVTLSLSRPVG